MLSERSAAVAADFNLSDGIGNVDDDDDDDDDVLLKDLTSSC